MNTDISQALEAGGIADITTTGRKTEQARRIEIVFHHLDGRLYITGRPGRRGWYANLLADPSLTLHLKRGVRTDLGATATPVTDPTEKEGILRRIMTEGFRIDPDKVEENISTWVQGSPLISLSLDE